MKVLLISPNTLVVPYPVYPIGLDYVAGSLSEKHQVQTADLNILSHDELKTLLKSFSPDIIGLSIRNIDNTEACNPLFFISEHKKLVDWIRSHCNAPIVGGGAGFTILPHEIFDALELDYGIIGEGERFEELLNAIENKQTLSGIPGLITAANTSDTTPASPWKGTVQRQATQSNLSQFYLDHGGMLNLQTKRGCSFRCIYCPYPHIEGKKHRLVDPDNVANMALKLQDNGAKYIFITDSAFNSDVTHSLKVAEAFKRHGLSIPWGGFFAPIKLPADYFQIMKECGLKHVEFGTEALSKTMLKNYQKPFSPEDVIIAHKQAVEAKLNAAHYFLLGGPGETVETVDETLDAIEHLKKIVLFFFTGIRIYPHTGLYKTALKEGKITEETSLLEPFYYESDAISHSMIEKQVIDRCQKRINWIVGSGGNDAAATISKMHKRGYAGPLWEYLIR